MSLPAPSCWCLKSKQRCVLVLLHRCLQEYCDKGTLDSVVSGWEGEEEGDARMLERLLLLKDVASGLQALHANNVVHGDLVRSSRACLTR